MRRRKDRGRRIDGWLVIDKPRGMTSARALAHVLALTGAAKGGHAGTLDPLATGVLPIALGEATKASAHAVEGQKRYRFAVRWGEARATDDAEGEVTARSPERPARAAIEAVLPGFLGCIDQVPPAFAAVKCGGRPAYERARRGELVDLARRRVRIDRLELVDVPDSDHAVFEVACGKGTYVRALARDLAWRLGTVGHVVDLRRLAAGPFSIEVAISLDKLAELVHSFHFNEHLLPIDTALADIPALPISDMAANLLRQGRAVRVPSAATGSVRATAEGKLIALARVAEGELRPVRVFNL